MSTTPVLGNVAKIFAVTIVKDWPAVAAATTDEVSLSVPGAQLGDFVIVEKTSLKAGLGLCSARVSAVDTVKVTVVNSTAGSLNETSEDVRLLFFRPEQRSLGTVLNA